QTPQRSTRQSREHCSTAPPAAPWDSQRAPPTVRPPYQPTQLLLAAAPPSTRSLSPFATALEFISARTIARPSAFCFSARARLIVCSSSPSSSRPTSVSASHGTAASCFCPASAAAERDTYCGLRHFASIDAHSVGILSSPF